jgi:hypothetical protein
VEPIVVGVFSVAAFVGATAYRRWSERRRRGVEAARNVEAERIIALLSSRQPGVWDVDDLRERVATTARDLWSAPDREALARLETWVHPDLLGEQARTWPPRAERREVRVKFVQAPAFLHVAEGGPDHDKVIARVESEIEGAWLDAHGKRLRRERRGAAATYHHWIHIDGQGWRLETIAPEPPVDAPPPSSVACRILPQGASEETGSQA